MHTDQVGEIDVRRVNTQADVEFWYLEQLPLILRRDIQNAPYDYCVEEIYRHYIQWKKDNWFFAPDDTDYLYIMRSNFQADVHRLTPAEVYNPNYVLTRRPRNVPRKNV